MIGRLDAEIPDLPEPITAWRCWHLVTAPSDGTPILMSVNNNTAWPPVNGWESAVIRDERRNFITAKCRQNPRVAMYRNVPVRIGGPTPPTSGCYESPSRSKSGHVGVGCGIYAYKTIQDLAWDFPLSGMSGLIVRPGSTVTVRRMINMDLVWGKVLLWGKVYEHQHGYRAQFARVESLAHVPGTGLPVENLTGVAEFYGVPLEIVRDVDVTDLNVAIAKRAAEAVAANRRPFGQPVSNLSLAIHAIKTAIKMWINGAIEEAKKRGSNHG